MLLLSYYMCNSGGGIYTYYLSVWCWSKIYSMIKYIFLSFLMKTVLSNLFKSCLFCCVSSSMVELFQGDKKQMGMTSRLRQLTMGTAESYQHPLCAKINELSNSRRTYKVQICWLLPVRACNEQQCSVWICSHTFKHLKALFFFPLSIYLHSSLCSLNYQWNLTDRDQNRSWFNIKGHSDVAVSLSSYKNKCSSTVSVFLSLKCINLMIIVCYTKNIPSVLSSGAETYMQNYS